MDEQTKFKIEILARTDAIWRPARAADWVGSTPGLRYEMQRDFRAAGVPWQGDGGTEAKRKAAQRLLETMVEAGEIVCESETQKSRLVKLSDEAEIRLRWECLLPGVELCHDLLHRLQANGCQVSEEDSALSGIPAGQWAASELALHDVDELGGYDVAKGYHLDWVMQLALPGLVRGWLTSRSDADGRVHYLLTAAGEQAAKGPRPAAPDLPDVTDEQPCDLYYSARSSFVDRMRRMKADNPGEIGSIPLPCGWALPRQSHAKSKRRKRS